MDTLTWPDGPLRARGFHLDDDRRSYRRGDMRLTAADGWLSIAKNPPDRTADPLRELAKYIVTRVN